MISRKLNIQEVKKFAKILLSIRKLVAIYFLPPKGSS